jgi:anti-sigma regulatory factor (Ser/Thr protein kinase)
VLPPLLNSVLWCQRRFPVSEPRLAGWSRRLVVEALDAWGLSPLAEDMRLCVSELATNAARYASGAVGIDVYYWPELGLAALEVTDDHPDPPSPQDSDDMDEHGRGLLIVQEHSSRGWTVRLVENDQGDVVGKAITAYFVLTDYGLHSAGPRSRPA